MWEGSIVRAMCGVQLKDKSGTKNLMFMFGLNETMNQLVVANSVCWSNYVLRWPYSPQPSS